MRAMAVFACARIFILWRRLDEVGTTCARPNARKHDIKSLRDNNGSLPIEWRRRSEAEEMALAAARRVRGEKCQQ